MSLLKEINESHDSLKALSLNLFLIPFWFIAIFLFNNEFYSSNDTLIILVMALVISLFSSTFLSLSIHLLHNKYNKDIPLMEQMGISIILLCAWISLIIFFVYSLGFFFKIFIYFYYFLVIYFIPLILTFLVVFINHTDNKNNKKSNKTIEKK